MQRVFSVLPQHPRRPYTTTTTSTAMSRPPQKRARPPAATPSSSITAQFANLFEAFDAIGKEMRDYDEKRETVIKKSRDVQKQSKQAIFSVHRGDIDQAKNRLESAMKVHAELESLIQETPGLRHGSFSNAMEEYAEARIFLHFHETKSLLVPADLPQTNTDEYLGGLLDFTGELNRWAVIQATSRKVDDVKYARDCVDAVLSVMMELDLRNGQVRKKYDSLKYCLKNLEKVLYELSLGQDIGLNMNAEKAGEAIKEPNDDDDRV